VRSFYSYIVKSRALDQIRFDRRGLTRVMKPRKQEPARRSAASSARGLYGGLRGRLFKEKSIPSEKKKQLRDKFKFGDNRENITSSQRDSRVRKQGRCE
jgi:hypothetical protein